MSAGQANLKGDPAHADDTEGGSVARHISMGVSPITSIRAVSLLKPGKEESCVPPPFAVDPCEVTGEDTYDSGGSRSDRGLEDEQDVRVLEPEVQIEEDGGSASEAVDPDAGVNLIA